MKRMLAVLSMVLLSSMLILGCDGGDEVSDTSVKTSFTPEDAVVLTGTVATDKPLRGVVQAINTRGETSDEVLADAGGRFSLSIANYPPFLLRMMHRDQGLELFSFTASEGHVNVTPLTHLAMYVAVGGEVDLATLFHEWDGSQLSPEEIQMAAVTVNANLAPLLHKHGLDDKAYDFFHTDFKPNRTGIGAVLDTVRIHIDPAADTLNRAIRILDASGRQLLPFDPNASHAHATEASENPQKKKDDSQ